MHNCSHRRNGGIGITVDTGLSLIAKKSKKTNIHSELEDFIPTKIKLESLLERVKNLLSLQHSIEIFIHNENLQHIGLGSGTSITLAVLEALLRLNDYEYSELTLQRLSGRGGTSGVGIHSYFCGGFTYDVGVKVNEEEHLPSSFVKDHPIPTLLFRKDYPFGGITFLHPKTAFNNHGLDEHNFFKEVTPLNTADALLACYNSVFKISASITESDKEGFIDAVEELKQTRWKKLEIEHSGKITQSILSDLYKNGVRGASMSSMGPGIFIVDLPHKNLINEIKEKYNLNEIQLTPNNHGRTINNV